MEDKKVKLTTPLAYFFLMFYTLFDAFAAIGPFNSLVKIFFYALVFCLIIKNYSFNGKIFFMLLLLILSFIVKLVIEPSSFKLNFRSMITIFNPFIFFLLFSSLSNKEKFFSLKPFRLFFRIFYGAVYSSLILGRITGVGLYLRFTKFAYCGYFLGTNEIGIYLILILIYLLFLKNYLFESEIFFVLIANMLSGYLVFTKSSLAAAFFSFIALNLLFKPIKILSIFLFCSIIFVSLFKETFFTKFFIKTFSQSTYIELLTSNLVHFIFNSRELYFAAFFKDFTLDTKSFFQILFFGLGDFQVVKYIIANLYWTQGFGVNEIGRAAFEMDFFDLFFFHGVIFTSLYIYFLIQLVKGIGEFGGFFIKLLIYSIIIHSFLAGHVLFSTGVTNVSLFLYFFVQQNKKLLQENQL